MPLNELTHLSFDFTIVFSILRNQVCVTTPPLVKVLHHSVVLGNAFFYFAVSHQHKVLFNAEFFYFDHASWVFFLVDHCELPLVLIGELKVFLQTLCHQNIIKFAHQVLQVIYISLKVFVISFQLHRIYA